MVTSLRKSSFISSIDSMATNVGPSTNLSLKAWTHTAGIFNPVNMEVTSVTDKELNSFVEVQTAGMTGETGETAGSTAGAITAYDKHTHIKRRYYIISIVII